MPINSGKKGSEIIPKTFMQSLDIDYRELEFGNLVTCNQYQTRINQVEDLIEKFKEQTNSPNFVSIIQVLLNLTYVKDLLIFEQYNYKVMTFMRHSMWKSNYDRDQIINDNYDYRQKVKNKTQFGKYLPLPKEKEMLNLMQTCKKYDPMDRINIKGNILDHDNHISVFGNEIEQEYLSSLINYQISDLRRIGQSNIQYNNDEKIMLKAFYQQKRLHEIYLQKLKKWYLSVYNPKLNPQVELKPNTQSYTDLSVTDNLDLFETIKQTWENQLPF